MTATTNNQPGRDPARSMGTQIPRIPLLLTLLGLFPFLASAGGFIWADMQRAELEPLLMDAQGTPEQRQAYLEAGGLLTLSLQSLFFYSAAILSFLGGARWGMAIREAPLAPNSVVLVLSVFPALVAWIALLIGFQPATALLMLIGAFGAHLLWDLAAVQTGEAPGWYRPLRTLATVGAVVALAAAYARLIWPAA